MIWFILACAGISLVYFAEHILGETIHFIPVCGFGIFFVLIALINIIIVAG